MTGSALVTGARRGIGKAIALALADAGFDVAVADVAASDELEAVADGIRGKGRKAVAIAGDIAAIETHARACWMRPNRPWARSPRWSTMLASRCSAAAIFST